MTIIKNQHYLRNTVLVILFACTMEANAFVAPGDLDTNFGVNGLVTDTNSSQCNALALAPDGTILTTGTLFPNFALARYSPTGTLISSIITEITSSEFGRTLISTINGIGLNSQGTIYATGSGFIPHGAILTPLASYNADLSLNTTFSPNGTPAGTLVLSSILGTATAYAIAIDAQEKIVIAGGDFLGFIARINSDGSLDTTFNASGPTPGVITGDSFASITGFRTLVIASDGTITAGGYFSDPISGNNTFAFARFTQNGDYIRVNETPITTPTGLGSSQINALTLDAQGNMIAIGQADDGQSPLVTYFTIARYTPDGNLDTTFGTNGITTTLIGLTCFAYSVIIDPYGKIVVGGTDYNGTGSVFALARYTSNGTLDPAFGTGGIVTTDIGDSNSSSIRALIQTPYKNNVIAGGSCAVSAQGALGLAEYYNELITAVDGSVTTRLNTATTIPLIGTEANSLPLTFSIIAEPANGTVSGLIQPVTGAPVQTAIITYTPHTGFLGEDQFTFDVHNGTDFSNTATVTVTVGGSIPVAIDGTTTTAQNVAIPVTLTATDVSGIPLIFSIVSNPTHGTVSAITQPTEGTEVQTATLTYTPDANFSGTDTFTFIANNGSNSNIATETVTIVKTSASNDSFITQLIRKYYNNTASD